MKSIPHEFWRTHMRPANFDPNVAVPERRPVSAMSVEEAERIIAAEPPVIIGDKEYKPTLIEGLIPHAARV